MLNTVDQKQIDAWKAEHGEVFKITVGDKSCYLKKPGRKVLSFASAAGTKDPMQFNEVILRECWLGGDEEIKTDDGLFLSASAKLPELIQVVEAELVKL
ncbi:hypothetical protein EGY05_08240 [Chryseobacterium arthrosphaerae]|uniref:hypothetical protein n=1 Tax=Chryseobacterium arthrosphaerae TaxID=651561 RepID=UPI000F502660|nr:hypothetical protein [Chryseobacterium arthrosphaerae]AYZ11915.1 hypothetical protein EGY05_08240 [Chryseobacterium arthrosphaerae]